MVFEKEKINARTDPSWSERSLCVRRHFFRILLGCETLFYFAEELYQGFFCEAAFCPGFLGEVRATFQCFFRRRHLALVWFLWGRVARTSGRPNKSFFYCWKEKYYFVLHHLFVRAFLLEYTIAYFFLNAMVSMFNLKMSTTGVLD